MVRDISIDLWLCAHILGRSSQASHIPVVQYIPYGVQKQEEHHGSNLRDIKIIKIYRPTESVISKNTKCKVNVNKL